MMMKLVLVLVSLVLGVIAFVRIAPVRPQLLTDRYTQDTALSGGYVAVRRYHLPKQEIATAIARIARATPLTTQIGDSPLTFVTRTAFFGFPDVTQVVFDDGVMTIHAHLVFGISDLGVNKARVISWLDQLGPLTNAQ